MGTNTLATASRHTTGAPDRAPLDCRRLLSWSYSLRSPSAMHHTHGSFNGKRHQSEVSCPLDCYRQLTLMASTVS